MFRLLSWFTLLAVFYSCHNCVCIPSPGLKVGFITFDSTEVDTVISRKYVKGSSFTQLIDTVQWDASNVRFDRSNDTLHMAYYVVTDLLQGQYDYQLYVPGANRIFKIEELDQPQKTGDCSGKVMCVNMFVSAKINDTAKSVKDDVLYLKK